MSTTTQARLRAVAFAKAQLGHPYSEVLDGGVGPVYFDCSGLVQQAARAGGALMPRTTQSQYPALQKITAAELLPADLVYLKVPSDGGQPPQHVMMWLSPNLVIEAPHAGGFVQYSGIPNSPAESVYGYCRIAWPLDPAPGPSPTPAPPIQETAEMIASTPTGNGYWTCDATGAVDSFGDATYQGGLNPGAPLAAGGPGVPGGSLPAGDSIVSFIALAVATLDGQQGYWMESAKGGVYAFGAAGYHGGPNNLHLADELMESKRGQLVIPANG